MVIKRAALFLITLAAFAGCNRTAAPTAKYFSGQPVEHWLEAIRSSDAKTRKRAADVLGNVGASDPAVIPALVTAVKDQDAAVRDAAVLAISKIGPLAAQAADVLREAVKDSDATVRGHAATALERVSGSR